MYVNDSLLTFVLQTFFLQAEHGRVGGNTVQRKNGKAKKFNHEKHEKHEKNTKCAPVS